jgi:hypothetical protein
MSIVSELRRQRAAREPLPRDLRYSILRRDGFKCRNCGATPDDRRVRLQVDHIVPVAKGGSDDPSNLQTLCQDCNLGKGADDPTERDLEVTRRALEGVTDEERPWLNFKRRFAAYRRIMEYCRPESRVRVMEEYASVLGEARDAGVPWELIGRWNGA